MRQVKICGITNKEDALAAAQCGAAALGFIFYPPSPRYIPPEDALKIISALPDRVIKIGIFVNQKPEEVCRVFEHCKLDMIQLHGDESPEYCRLFPSSVIIKAVELKNENDINRAYGYDVAAILVDSRHAGLYGGTGKTVNWKLSSRISSKKPLILSGGLNAENVAAAMQTVNPAALDINSGAESEPGKKDHRKLAQIFDAVQTADTAPENLQLIFKKREI
ncbi:MAG: phosphoribosylanthranilate isomerase [Smithella sp.]